jgi:hypothetical protein
MLYAQKGYRIRVSYYRGGVNSGFDPLSAIYCHCLLVCFGILLRLPLAHPLRLLDI